MCAAYIEGCAFGAPLGVCRDVCDQARSACSSSLFAMPDDAKRRLECEQYVDGEWPACSNPTPNPSPNPNPNPNPSPNSHPAKVREEVT